ncbi:unnamed protein product [Cladocopium goreaui]|uniref:Calmodulin n=1 Tax=Cladocopium goreaui TaxID=2562237 RepID=A0A9P1D6R2_9DINO|nr:unnamed protein product [Cladocopium goreaui]
MSLRIFDRYDVDGSGQLERHELMKALTRNAHVLRALDSEITTAEIQHHDAADMTGHDGRVLQELDTSRDGKATVMVSYKEFLAWLKEGVLASLAFLAAFFGDAFAVFFLEPVFGEAFFAMLFAFAFAFALLFGCKHGLEIQRLRFKDSSEEWKRPGTMRPSCLPRRPGSKTFFWRQAIGLIGTMVFRLLWRIKDEHQRFLCRSGEKLTRSTEDAQSRHRELSWQGSLCPGQGLVCSSFKGQLLVLVQSASRQQCQESSLPGPEAILQTRTPAHVEGLAVQEFGSNLADRRLSQTLEIPHSTGEALWNILLQLQALSIERIAWQWRHTRHTFATAKNVDLEAAQQILSSDR